MKFNFHYNLTIIAALYLQTDICTVLYIYDIIVLNSSYNEECFRHNL